MSKFYYNDSVTLNVTSTLNNTQECLQNAKKYTTAASERLIDSFGFGVENLLNSIYEEVRNIDVLNNFISDGVSVINDISGASKRYSESASAIVSAVSALGDKTVQNVINAAKNAVNSSESELIPDRAPADKVITFDNAKHGDVFTTNGFTYQKFCHWEGENLLRIDGAGGIGLVKKDGSAYDGYSQNQDWWWNTGNGKAWVNPAFECTSAALATSSTINGLGREPDDYNDWGGITQIGGVKFTSEQVTKYCVDSLKNGCSTVIYYNYEGCDGLGANGHAVTVVGADPNPTSVYDLWVIDPVDGQCKSFSQAYGAKSNNFYICYESNPDSFGGAGVKKWDIEQYFGINF